MRILVIDNYDSFTFNLVQLFASLGAEVDAVRNDAIDLDAVRARRPAAVVISPGPRRPEHAGISTAIVASLGASLPILGVCLGHQSIAQAFGARIVKDRKIFHGKTSRVFHDGKTIYAGVETPFVAARYHSLVVQPSSLPSCLEVTSRTDDGVIMGLRHREWPIEGVQFHPESFMTPAGSQIARNFLTLYATRGRE